MMNVGAETRLLGSPNLVWLPFGMIAFLSGCSTAQVPYTQNHPVSYQKVANATSHWDILANDIAAQTMAAIGAKKTIFVAAPSEVTDFNLAFRNFLITRMVNNGIPVSKQKDGSIEVQYETQIVRHNSARKDYKIGTITMLTSGLMVAYNVSNWPSAAQDVALMGGAIATDAIVSSDSGKAPKTELVVTTSVVDGGRYLVRKTDIYYIEPEDASLFLHIEKQETKETPSREFSVVGAK